MTSLLRMDSSISHDPKAPDVVRTPRAPEESDVPIEYSGPTNQPEVEQTGDEAGVNGVPDQAEGQEAASPAQTAAGADADEAVEDSASEATEAGGETEGA